MAKWVICKDTTNETVYLNVNLITKLFDVKDASGKHDYTVCHLSDGNTQSVWETPADILGGLLA